MTEVAITTNNIQQDALYQQFVANVQKRLDKVLNDHWNNIHALIKINLEENRGNYNDFLACIQYELGEEYVDWHTCNRCTSFIDVLGPVLVVYKDGTIEPLIWQLYGENNVFETVSKDIRAGMLEYIKNIPQPLVSSFSVSSPDLLKLRKAQSPQSGGFDHFHIDSSVIVKLAKQFDRKTANVIDDDVFSWNFSAGFYRNDAMWLRDAKKALAVRSSVPKHALLTIDKAIAFYDRCFNLSSLKDKYTSNVVQAIAKSAAALEVHRTSIDAERLRLNNTTIGNLVMRAQTDVEHAIRSYLSETDTRTYLGSDKASLETTLEAERYFEDNGLAESIQLRYATLDEMKSELDHIWWEKDTAPTKKGIFSGVSEKLDNSNKENKNVPLAEKDFVKTSMEDFVKNKLPNLHSLRIHPKRETPIGFITTMKNKEASRPFKWTTEDGLGMPGVVKDVPYAWLFLSNSGLGAINPQPITVKAVMEDPQTQALGGCKHKYTHLMFILSSEGTRLTSRGVRNSMFAEILREDLFKYRRVVTAYNQLEENVFKENADHLMVGFTDDSLKSNGFSLKLSGVDADGNEVGYNIVM